MKLIMFFLMCIMPSTFQAQSFSSLDNVGQHAFNIVRKLDTMSEAQFAQYFSNAKNIYEHITGEKIPSSWKKSNYLDIQEKTKKSGIKWSKVKFNSFKYYSPHEENGVMGTKGRLYLQYDNKELCVSVYVIQYEGKYYLISIN